MEKNENSTKVKERDVTAFKLFNQMRYGRSRKKVRLDGINKAQERDHSHWVKVQKKQKTG